MLPEGATATLSGAAPTAAVVRARARRKKSVLEWRWAALAALTIPDRIPGTAARAKIVRRNCKGAKESRQGAGTTSPRDESRRSAFQAPGTSRSATRTGRGDFRFKNNTTSQKF